MVCLNSVKIISTWSLKREAQISLGYRHLANRILRFLFLGFENCSLYFASCISNLASEGSHMIYHDSIYDVMIEPFPDYEHDFRPAKGIVSYM